MSFQSPTATSASMPTGYPNLPTFHRWPQALAQRSFTTLLKHHMPDGATIYNRLLAPHNTPDRYCLFAATFPPPAPLITPNQTYVRETALQDHENENKNANENKKTEDIYTLVFADRSRHKESQIWIFNPLASTPASASSSSESTLLTSHLHALLLYLKTNTIPSAPGHPFSSTLRFACLSPGLALPLTSLAKTWGPSALPYETIWNQWFLPLGPPASQASPLQPPLPAPPPAGLVFGTVPREQLGTVLSTSKLARQADALLLLPNVALLTADGGGGRRQSEERGRLVAWCYIGIDGAVATLYVLPEYRERGLGLLVAEEAVRRYGAGEMRMLVGEEGGTGDGEERLWAFDGSVGWTYADVQEGNKGSESVMRRLGAEVQRQSRYIHVDAEFVQ